MDKLNIGETILKLRKEKNITQEQLALMVGVSAGAVSKWENGKSTPDISLLSPLARALDTSLDILLSFQQELSEKQVDDIKKELMELFLHESYDAGEAKCKEYLKEYPNSIHLKFTAAGLIQMYSMMSEDHSEEFISRKMEECLSLFRQVAESREPKYAPTALFCIAGIQMQLENYEESEKALNELPQKMIDPMALYPTLLLKQGKDEKARKVCSGMLMQYLNNACLMLTNLANIFIAQKDYDMALLYLDTEHKMQETFKIGLYSAAYNCSKLYMKLGQKETAAKWFKIYVEGLLSFGYDYKDNPYFKDYELEINPEGQRVIRKRFIQSLIKEDEFKSLFGIPEYEEAVKKLKKFIDII